MCSIFYLVEFSMGRMNFEKGAIVIHFQTIACCRCTPNFWQKYWKKSLCAKECKKQTSYLWMARWNQRDLWSRLRCLNTMIICLIPSNGSFVISKCSNRIVTGDKSLRNVNSISWFWMKKAILSKTFSILLMVAFLFKTLHFCHAPMRDFTNSSISNVFIIPWRKTFLHLVQILLEKSLGTIYLPTCSHEWSTMIWKPAMLEWKPVQTKI